MNLILNPAETLTSKQTMATEIIAHPYDLSVQDNFQKKGCLNIHMWCLDRESKPVLIRILDYPATLQIELPRFINGRPFDWDQNTATEVIGWLCRQLKEHAPDTFHFHMAEKLYMYRNHRKSPMVLLTFKTSNAMWKCNDLLKTPQKLGGFGTIKLEVHELGIQLLRKFCTDTNLGFAQWFKVDGFEIQPDNEERISIGGTEDRPISEYIVDWKSFEPLPSSMTSSWVTKPLIMAVDIETYTPNHKSMPDKLVADNYINVMAVIFQKRGERASRKRYLITIGNTDPIEDTTVINVENEEQLLDNFFQLWEEYMPDIITGHNIYSYDFPYILTRLNGYGRELPKEISRIPCIKPDKTKARWKSDGAGYNNMDIPKVEGCISFDTLPIIKRDYKLSKYSLEAVGQHFLGQGKHDIKFKVAFKAWEDLMSAQEKIQEKTQCSFGEEDDHLDRVSKRLKEKYLKAKEIMTTYAKYCRQDSELVLELLEKLNIWVGMIELSNIVGVTIMELFTRGQQIRCVSQVYDKAHRMGYVLDKRIVPEVFYEGGFVGKPKPGKYKDVICLDFSSLYPSIMMAFNVCYTTLVPQELVDEVPDEDCNVIEFEQEEPADFKPGNFQENAGYVNEGPIEGFEDTTPDSKEIEGKTVKRKYKYKWYKKEKGVIPTIVHDLVAARKQVKNEIARLEEIVNVNKQMSSEIKAEKDLKDLEITVASVIADLEAVLKTADKKQIWKIKSDLGFQKLFLEVIRRHKEKEKNQILKALGRENEDLEVALVVLDKRQLAIKVSANSMYGFLGVQKGGVLPLIEGAMCTTAMGRRLIKDANDFLIEKYNATIVYNDTDSSMFTIPGATRKNVNKWGHRIAEEINGTPEIKLPDGTVVPAKKGLFPPPLKMEFEKAMGALLCFAPKMYCATLLDDDGAVSLGKDGKPKMLTRGIILARRDSCKWAQKCYKSLLEQILSGGDIIGGFNTIIDACVKILRNQVNVEEELTTVKGLGGNYANDSYFMKKFADTLLEVGYPVKEGDRLEFVYVINENEKEIAEAKARGWKPEAKDKKYYEGLCKSHTKMRMIDMWLESQSFKGKDLEAIPEDDRPAYPPEEIDAFYYVEHFLQNPCDKAFNIGFVESLEEEWKDYFKQILYKPAFATRCKAVSVITPIKMVALMIKDLRCGKKTAEEIADDVEGLKEWFREVVEGGSEEETEE
jgi:DNA polymerase elongation subunit (family B)